MVLAEFYTTKLQVSLHKLENYYRQGALNKRELRAIGEININELNEEYTQRIIDYVSVRGFDATKIRENQQEELEETLELWRNIVRDL